MPTPAYCRSSKYRVVFDGQSLNLIPGPLTGGFPATCMKSFPGVPWVNPSIGSTSWTVLTPRATQRGISPESVWDWALMAEYSVLVMNGGTSDIFSEGDSGAKLYADEGNYATLARAAGFDYIINCTTHPSTAYGAQTNIASASDNVNVNTLTGTQSITVNDTTNLNGAGVFAASGTIRVGTDGSNVAVITYGSKDATHFLNCTTTSGSGILHTGQLVGKDANMTSKLIDGNALTLADATTGSHYYDAVADFVHEPRLADPANTSYFSDGTHWTGVGAGIGAGIVVPLLQVPIKL